MLATLDDHLQPERSVCPAGVTDSCEVARVPSLLLLYALKLFKNVCQWTTSIPQSEPERIVPIIHNISECKVCVYLMWLRR